MFRRARRFLGVVWLAVNQTVNALMGGDAQMTVSARIAYARERGSQFGFKACKVLSALDLRDNDPERGGGDHCVNAQDNYEARVRKAEAKRRELREGR